VSQNRTELDSMHAKSIRVGAHPDKVRVVIDGGSAERPFEGRRMVPTSGGLVVALGSGSALDEALAEVSDRASGMALATAGSMDEPMADAMEAPTVEPMEESMDETDGMDSMEADLLATPNAAPNAALDEMALAESMDASPSSADEPADPAEITPAAEAAPVTIYGVEFDTQQQRDRIVVLGERTFDYLVYEPDAETVVLAIENATIDPEAAVRIAPEPGGPVSLVTAFAQPDLPNAEVRVVMTRAAGLAPEISRRGSLLVVDFPRNGQVAATPPVLAPVPGEPLLANAPGQDGASAVAPGSASPASIAPHAETPSAAVPALARGSQPNAVPASLEPPAAIGILEEGGLIDGKEYTGRRISLDFKDVEIADVLRLIAEVSDLNVIAGDEVAGRVTIRLVDVPWDQALDVILLTKSLGFMRVGNVLRIAPSDVIKAEEEMRLQERRAKEKLEDLVVKLQPVNYANVKDIEKMVKRLLSPRGSVNIDQRTNTLIMKDIPSVIDESTALIKAIDTQTPQVMIEAKIVEASLDFSREFGSVWSFGAQPFADPFNPAGGVRSDLGNDAFRLNTNSSNNAIFANPITAAPTGLFNLAGYLLDEKLNLGLQLQAAEVNGDGKVISSPRVVTLDNSEASIEQGVSIPFQTFENGDAQLEFVDAVLALDVTPHITADKSIIMEIEVSRNAPDDSVFTLTGSPAIAKNQVQTETLVKDGQTLVLGGIYVIDKSQRQARVPYLHRIPILGAAFRSDEISDSRKELLIFVTPRIVVTQQEGS
jgi:type IV pilus assembly protein PilQ